MTILDDLLSSLDLDVSVRSVLVGVHWTIVCSRFCGLASTFTNEKTHGHNPVRDAGHLHEKSARELAQYAYSDNLLEASIGVAAINSLIDVDESSAVEINAVDVLIENGQGKDVALVGHFPFISKLRQSVGQLWVIEQNPIEGEYPVTAADELIPRAEVIAITASALVNHTIDGLLALCRPQAFVMVLGPSTPLSQVLFTHGATILSGVRVRDEAAVIRTISQGASFQQVEGVRLLTFRKSL
jgi:uncharacterized protein (DUF4213/DUF364 family)